MRPTSFLRMKGLSTTSVSHEGVSHAEAASTRPSECDSLGSSMHSHGLLMRSDSVGSTPQPRATPICTRDGMPFLAGIIETAMHVVEEYCCGEPCSTNQIPPHLT